MGINSTESKNFIIDKQNKLIEFLYKQESNYVDQINEARENLEAIYDLVAKVYDKIEEGEADTYEILEDLASIQNLTKL